MAEEIDDNDFFQQDFTTASEWEIFNARLEEIFHEWKLPYVEIGENLTKNELSLCNWETTNENIFFADVELNVVRYRMKLNRGRSGSDTRTSESDRSSITTSDHVKEIKTCQAFNDLMSLENNFCVLDERSNGTIHPLAQWYGLRDFVVVSPVKKSISNESQIRILLSSIHIAVAESSCEVPVFVQVLERIQNVYLGVCECHSTRMNFDIVHLHTTPPTCKYLSGLLSMFKGKIVEQYVDPVKVTIRLSYSLTKFFNAHYASRKHIAFVDDEYDEPNENSNNFNILPFGVSIDPVLEIILHCSWPQVIENFIIDSPTNTYLDATLAEEYTIRTRFEDLPICYMSECLMEFLNLAETRRSLTELLGDSFMFGSSMNVEKNPLDVLTESKIPTLTSVIQSNRRDSKKKQKAEGPIDDDQLMNMLYYLFPDAQKDSEHPYMPTPEEEPFDPMKLKTAYPDSLVQRLSCLLALINTSFGGIKGLAQFWAEFSQEMRYRVENCILIPGIAKGFPDSRTCLLHQKLQMLNVCMERRKVRELGPQTATGGNRSGSDDEEDDEFFDCSDDLEESKRLASIDKPEGRLSRLGNMTLVDSDEPLFVPLTQDPVPKTEDQLEDDAEVMLKLGPGSELRAQMMSASLLSDMESFKAANPFGKMEDFIRWYSPRDWIENDDDNDEKSPTSSSDGVVGKIKGKLSSRMLIPGNTWQMVWEQAKPVPARRQKRLFDDAKEAEKVLHFLESRNIGQVVQLTIATAIHAAIIRIQDELASDKYENLDIFDELERIVMNCCKLSRECWAAGTNNPRGNSNKKWENLVTEITNLEYMVEQIRSVRKKLFTNSEVLCKDEGKILESILKGFEVSLSDGIQNSVVKRMFGMFSDAKNALNEQPTDDVEEYNANMSLPDPYEKQFILRVSGNTVGKGVYGPQFMRAILGNNEFRLCGAFSQDTTFY